MVAGGSPSLVTIVGEPGSGKSRLADELLAGLEPGVVALHGHGQVAAGTSFAPVAAIVRQLSGIDEGDDPERAMARLRELVQGCCDATEVERIAGGLGLSLGLAEPRLDESAFVQDVQGGSCGSWMAWPPAGPSCWCSKTRTRSLLRCSI